MPVGSGNLAPFQPPPDLSIAPSAQVETQTAANTMNQSPQMPGNYYGGHAGAAAYLADKVLTGWMSGKYLGEQKQREKAANTIGTLNDAVQQSGAAYRAAVESGDPKQVEAAGKVLQQQWDEYNAAREKYVIPEDMGGKKSTGEKIKGGLKKAFVPQGPQLYAKAAIDISKQTDPRQLFGPSKREQQESKITDMQLSSMEREQKNQTQWEQIALKPDKDLTPEDKKFKEYYEYMKFGRTKEQTVKDDLLTKVVNNGQLSDNERQLAESYGMLKPKVASTQIRTIQDPKTGSPISQLVSIGPDGKLVSTSNLPGKDYIGPNQAQLAGQVINNQVSALKNWGKKAHPDWDDKQLTQWALASVTSGASAATADWFQKNQEQDVMNRAIGAVLQKHQHYSATGGRTYDDVGQVLGGVFATPDNDGRYMWNSALPGAEKHWLGFGADTYQGHTKEELQSYENGIRAELRSELRKQNPKLSDTDIDKMMPASMFSKQQPGGKQGGMSAPPQAPGTGSITDTVGQAQAMQAPPDAGGTKLYEVKLPDGTITRRQMSQEYADSLQAQGVKVTQLSHE
jgi:hypothetical protein